MLKPLECKCDECGNKFTHTFNWINALEPHEAKPNGDYQIDKE